MVAVNGQGSMWEEVAAKIRSGIASGALKPGDKVPTEPDLEEEFGLSRTTVRRALLQLVSEGLITEGRGKQGRKVADRRPVEMPFAASETRERADQRRERNTDAWVTDMKDQDREGGEDLKVEVVKATPRIAALLEIPEGSPVVERSHVRTVDGRPHNLSSTFYERDLVAGTAIMDPDDIPQGVILYMQDEMGIHQTEFLYEFEARMPTRAEVTALRIPAGVPVIVHYTTGYAEGRPVKLTVTTWPADRARLIARLRG